MPKVKMIEYVGEKDAYDLEVKHPDHQFYTAQGILTSNSHAVAYAIDSYFAAWLFTYYPKQWLATILQSENNSPKGLAKAISEVKRLGYRFASMDVNHSGVEWEYSPSANAFVPPLSSVKGVGGTAAEEIIATRPFTSINQMLFDDEGKWYHSKMNKTAFSALCECEAFGSLEEFQDGRLENHRQLFTLLIDNYQLLRKGIYGMTKTQVKRLEKQGQVPGHIVDQLLDDVDGLEDWSRHEKIDFNLNRLSQVPNDLLFPDGLLEKLEERDLMPLTELRGGKKGICWFVAKEIDRRKTKRGKVYLRVKAGDDKHEQVSLKVWSADGFNMDPYSIWLCEATGDDKWGPSTSKWKLRPLEE